MRPVSNPELQATENAEMSQLAEMYSEVLAHRVSLQQMAEKAGKKWAEAILSETVP